MTAYKAIYDALEEVRAEYHREIMKWYRIRRRALARGLTNLAQAIYEDIQDAENELHNLDFRNWNCHEFLFNPSM